MAQTGYTPILIYSSSTASQAPTAGNLTNSTLGSELAINITDGKLFYKDNGGSVQVIGWKTVPTTAGGTGLTSYTAGDLLYYATGTTLSKLAIGASTTILTSSGTAPQWSAASGITVGTATNIAGGAAGSVPYQTGAGATSLLAIGTAYYQLGVNAGGTAPAWQPSATSVLTTQGDLLYASAANTLARLAKNNTASRYLSNSGTSNNPAWAQIDLTNGVTGTLPTTNGGTGLTSFSSGGIVYASSTSALATNNSFIYASNVFSLNVPGIASYSATAAPTYSMGLLTDGSANSRYTSFAINSRGAAGQSQTCYITCVPGASDGDASLRFSTYGGYAVSEALNLTKDQDVSVTKGNLIIATSGKGIDFSATPNTGTSELLADYEEGTWGPSIASSGTTVGTGSEYGTYIKVGKLVYASFSLNAYTTGGTQTNALQITGLPYTVQNVSGTNSGHGVLINTSTTGFLRATKNATTIDIYQNDGTAITPTTAGINNSNIRGLNGTVVYYAST